MIANPEAIAVNQAWAGGSGAPFASSVGTNVVLPLAFKPRRGETREAPEAGSGGIGGEGGRQGPRQSPRSGLRSGPTPSSAPREPAEAPPQASPPQEWGRFPAWEHWAKPLARDASGALQSAAVLLLNQVSRGPRAIDQ